MKGKKDREMLIRIVSLLTYFKEGTDNIIEGSEPPVASDVENSKEMGEIIEWAKRKLT